MKLKINTKLDSRKRKIIFNTSMNSIMTKNRITKKNSKLSNRLLTIRKMKLSKKKFPIEKKSKL